MVNKDYQYRGIFLTPVYRAHCNLRCSKLYLTDELFHLAYDCSQSFHVRSSSLPRIHDVNPRYYDEFSAVWRLQWRNKWRTIGQLRLATPIPLQRRHWSQVGVGCYQQDPRSPQVCTGEACVHVATTKYNVIRETRLSHTSYRGLFTRYVIAHSFLNQWQLNPIKHAYIYLSFHYSHCIDSVLSVTLFNNVLNYDNASPRSDGRFSSGPTVLVTGLK